MIMKIWVDDVRTIPDKDYILAKSTNEAISIIQGCEEKIRKTGEVPSEQNIVIDLDHDSGDFLYEKWLIVFLFYVIVKTLTKCKIDYIINRRKQNWAFLIN